MEQHLCVQIHPKSLKMVSCHAAHALLPARFVTKAELGKLGLGHLVGTPLASECAVSVCRAAAPGS